ncbi:hypothetical protein C0991_008734 [Blastosporella zonata]|nr:hypothetical protein C0991_008734 [Blastosporella zonata]
MASISTSQDFVRALKSASDPPIQGGPLKIEIARQTWDNVSFHVPNKAEVVVEWIMGKFLKEKDKETTLNPLLDLRCWTLLDDIISSPNIVGLAAHTRSLKTWLPPLLSRIPFAPSLLALLRLLADLDVASRLSLTRVVFTCLEITWPMSVQKLNTEAMLECFGTFLTAYRTVTEGDTDFVRIGFLLAASYRNSLSNSSNKKKVYLAFLQNFLPQWLELVTRPSADAALASVVYDTGIETMFNLDVLRRARDSRTENDLFESIAPVLASNIEVYTVLPHLFASFVESIRKNRGALVSQSSTQVPGASNTEIQMQGMQFFASCLSLLDVHETSSQAWSARVALLKVVDKESLFDRSNTVAAVLLDRVIERSLAVIEFRGLWLIRDHKVPGQSFLYLQFLDIILEYHSKTRTVNSYTRDLFTALLTASFQYSPNDVYLFAFSSPLLDATHLQRLSKALQTFLSENQVLSQTKTAFSFLTDEWEKFEAVALDTEQRSPKRRKTTEMDVDSDSPTNAELRSAVAFSVSTHLSMTVFSSLPMHAVIEDVRNDLRELLAQIRSFAQRIVKKTMKTLKKCDGDKKWRLSIVAAASLRLWYALDISGNVPEAPLDDDRLCKRALEAIQDEQLLPELFVELSRFLLRASLHRDASFSQAAFNHWLLYLEKNLQGSQVSWSGEVHGLAPHDQERCALALMHMIVERWLPVIESFASTEQLERLIKAIMSIDIAPTTASTGLQAQTLLLQTLHSAQFWELPNIRKYLARSSRAEFVRRALSLDRHISSSALSNASKREHLAIIRVFMSRIFANVNGSDLTVENLCEALEYLMSSTIFPSPLDEYVETTTMTLLESVFSETFRKLEKSSPDAMLNLVRAFAQIDIQGVSQTLNVHARSLTHMVAVLERDFKIVNFSGELQHAMRQLHQTLSMAIYPRISAFNLGIDSAESRRTYTNMLTLWHSLLCLKKWLGGAEDSPPSLVSEHISKLLTWQDKTSALDQTRVTIVAILLEELNFCPAKDRPSRLDSLLAGYTYTYRFLQPSARQQADSSLAKLCSNLSASEFSQALDLIADELKRNDSSEARIQLLQISAIIVRNHPQGTLKQMQTFLTRYLQTFLSWPGLFDGPIELRIQTLEFLVQYCTEQPAVLRAVDMGSIWSLLTNFLAGSRVHDNVTTLEIFHHIINIISALIRLRRDLVIHTLPHLGNVLRQLLMTVRAVRPNLGSKQTSLVTDTLPRWINTEHPVGVEEAKALARLLETLTAKSMVRNNVSNMETQKAESLTKPFSKHAAYVLKAYISAMNDPLCLLPSEHRRELQRGLYAICSMISDHNRDALMVGALDAGGKTTMKTLWKEYEKQRYVGKG